LVRAKVLKKSKQSWKRTEIERFAKPHFKSPYKAIVMETFSIGVRINKSIQQNRGQSFLTRAIKKFKTVSKTFQKVVLKY
jgi:hypothetical protein